MGTKTFRHDKLISLSLFLLAGYVRLKDISSPSSIVAEEVRMGQFVSDYIQRSFFFDIHPPLGKLLIALVGYLSGYEGDFDFSGVGHEYDSSVIPYVQMRSFGAILSAAVVPLGYLTLRDAGHSFTAAIIASLAICFENGIITNNRLIMVESYLLFFTALALFSWNRYVVTRPFNRSWLLVTGIALGCAVSTKWSGLFIVLTVFILNLKNSWDIIGDLKMTKRQLVHQSIIRFVCLVIIPIAIYITSFYIHFMILTEPGSGETYLPLESQNELNSEAPIDTPVPVAYGSVITIRQLATTGGYLHSHKLNYPGGSGQQQVTLYPYRDPNNLWKVLKAEDTVEYKPDMIGKNQTHLEYVRNWDTVRLEHVVTSPRKLHSHDIDAPITDTGYHKEVSAYGFVDFEGDANDYWRIEMENNSAIEEAGQFLQARRTKFRLRHPNSDCHLYAGFNRLPAWGQDQQEVSCIQEGLKFKTTWMVDETENPLLPDDVPMEHEKRLTFIEKFINIHKTMFTVTAESIGTSAFETKPSTWPIIKYVMVYWMSSDLQIIYMGNPSVYFTTTVSVLACLGIYGILVLRDKRHYKDTLFGLRNYYQNSAGFFMTAWSITYFMNFFVEKQMFSSDYQPSLYFAALVMGVVADFLVRPVPLGVQVSLMIAVGTVFAYAYRIYAPITYGQPWTYSGCKEASLRYTWDMRCGSYMATTATFAERQPEEEQVTLVDDSTQQAVFETPEALQNDIVDDVQQQIQKEDTIVEEDEREYQYNEEYDDDEYYNEEEEEEEEEEDEIEPTEPAPVVEYAPEYVNGSEVIYPDEEDEDDWPKTIYGFGEDPELEEFDEPNPDYDPKAIRPIPITRS